MDSGSIQALELLLIIGVVGYFILSQQNNLRRLKKEREAKQAEEAAKEATETNTQTSQHAVPPAKE
ncbi:MAG: hypothetical protein C1943_17380 [Halochromatium sp.]|nr:hypothetical protein [Halochromatium sp.]